MQPSAAQIGEKVSIRLHDPSGGYRDILGILESENTVKRRMAASLPLIQPK